MGGRKARQSSTYRAFVPDPIAAIQPAVGFATARLISEAETAVGQLNADERVRGLEAIGALLLRSEAIASSRIEGIELSQRNLARALIDPRAARGTAKAVAANVVAMGQAIAIGDGEPELTVADILAIHGTLMADEPARVRPGAFRREQNWIGGRLLSPSDARSRPSPRRRSPTPSSSRSTRSSTATTEWDGV
jgi:Fic/DOC family N-terminal